MRKLEKFIEEEFAGIGLNSKPNGLKGVKILHTKSYGILGCEVTLESDNDLNRLEGNYYTFYLPDYSKKNKDAMIKTLSKSIKKIIGINPKSILVLGMGNDKIISDSLGTRVVSNLSLLEILEKNNNIRFAKFCPGVVSVSGIESFDLCRTITKLVEPEVVIIVDSLCTKSGERLGKSFQLSDAGIVPGSAVGSEVCDLRSQTLYGSKVVCIGVPVVIYLEDIIEDIIKKSQPLNHVDFKTAIKNFQDFDGIFSPKDIDFIIDFSSEIVSRAIYSII